MYIVNILLFLQEGMTQIVDGQLVLVAGSRAVASTYREPFDGIQLRKLPEPPIMAPADIPGIVVDLIVTSVSSAYELPLIVAYEVHCLFTSASRLATTVLTSEVGLACRSLGSLPEAKNHYAFTIVMF